MAHEVTLIDVSTSDELLRLAEEVAQSGTGRVLARGDQPLVLVQPLPAVERPRRRRRATDPTDDSLLGIIGIVAGGGPSNVERFKDEYIAEAIDGPSSPLTSCWPNFMPW